MLDVPSSWSCTVDIIWPGKRGVLTGDAKLGRRRVSQEIRGQKRVEFYHATTEQRGEETRQEGRVPPGDMLPIRRRFLPGDTWSGRRRVPSGERYTAASQMIMIKCQLIHFRLG